MLLGVFFLTQGFLRARPSYHGCHSKEYVASPCTCTHTYTGTHRMWSFSQPGSGGIQQRSKQRLRRTQENFPQGGARLSGVSHAGRSASFVAAADVAALFSLRETRADETKWQVRRRLLDLYLSHTPLCSILGNILRANMARAWHTISLYLLCKCLLRE